MTRYRSGSWCHAVSTQDSKIGNTWEDEVVTLQTMGRRCMHTVKTQTDKRHEVSIFVCLCIAGAHSILSEDVSHARSAKNTTLLYHLFVETRTCVATETQKNVQTAWFYPTYYSSWLAGDSLQYCDEAIGHFRISPTTAQQDSCTHAHPCAVLKWNIHFSQIYEGQLSLFKISLKPWSLMHAHFHIQPYWIVKSRHVHWLSSIKGKKLLPELSDLTRLTQYDWLSLNILASQNRMQHRILDSPCVHSCLFILVFLAHSFIHFLLSFLTWHGN